ncbi:FAD-dependent oxidoreductase, partial [Pseudorhodoferax sp.]|uniref:FAD-dependent oxidoreductase n=1 Tax=Pseudorhodoferax sp. TaxID=1993553 RepID=UPI002DD692CD
MAAAIAHAQAGRRVTVFEAARTMGGRARAVPATLSDGTAATLDNGQHILIGAYAESLRLMRLVGVDADTALLRLPLTLQFPDGQGLQLPDLPPPLDALLGIARAQGWGWRDKLALLRTATAWQLGGFRCAPETSVAALCAPLTPRLLAEFIDPLCVSALNTPAHEASGQVFLRVLRDSLFSGRGGSTLLLPRTDLGALFPQAAAQWLTRQGGEVVTGQRVQQLTRLADGWRLDGASETFHHVTLAC